jgi:hypothetical protein
VTDWQNNGYNVNDQVQKDLGYANALESEGMDKGCFFID